MRHHVEKLGGRAASGMRSFHRAQNAQGMVFGAISLFMLVACIGLVHNSGVVTSRRIQAQTAADAAAHSGALVTANILSDVAWLNDGMAYIYYNLMRYAVDTTVYRTLAEVRDHNYWPEEKRQFAYVAPPSGAYMVGGGDPLQLYHEAYFRAAEMIPSGENWLRMLSDLQHGIAVSGKTLVQEAILMTAAKHSADVAAVSIIQNDPSGVIFRHDSEVEDIDLILEYNENGDPLWSITHNGEPYCDIYKLGYDHWRIDRLTQSLEILRRDEREWYFKTGDFTLDVIEYDDGVIQVEARGEQNASLLCIPINGGYAVIGESGGTHVEYVPLPGGGYQLTVDGSTAGIRQQDGKMQQWNPQAGRWETLSQQDSVNIDGKEVPITHSNTVVLPGNITLEYPGRIRFGPIDFSIPNVVRFGSTTITLLPNSVRVRARIGQVGLVIEGDDNNATINGLRTRDPRSAIKREYWIDGVWGHHRIQTDIPEKRWVYKWRQVAAIFTREDLNRFGHHAVADAEAATGIENTWTEWFDVGRGRRQSTTAYHQTVPCWNTRDGNCDGYIGNPANNHMCVTCNPYYAAWHYDESRHRWVYVQIDSDQRLETDDFGDYILDKDGDGRSDVRKYGANSAFFTNRLLNYSLGFQLPTDSNGSVRDMQSIRITGVRPLCLTSSVFAHPLVVTVWLRPDRPFLGTQGGSRMPVFRNPSWGYFAMATARVGVLDSRSMPSYRYTFDPEVDLHYKFNFGEADFMRRLEYRDDWLASYHNHYEPVWTARLWSTSEAMRSVDMEIAHRQQELGEWDEVGRNFLWRMLASQEHWYDPTGEDLERPRIVREARRRIRSMRGPGTGRFRVGHETPTEQLLDAIRH